MQKVVIVSLIVSFVLLSGCIFDGGEPVVPDTPQNITSPIQNQSSFEPINDSVEQPVELPQNTNQTDEIQNTTNDVAGGLDDEVPPKVDEPLELAQEITADAYLDSNLGRYQTKRCWVKLRPTEIDDGATTSVEIYAYSPTNEQVTFLCGDYEKIQGTGGLFQDVILCDFSGPGVTDVWLKLDGHICASAPLKIRSPVTRFDRHCDIMSYTSLDESRGGSRHFEASVYVSNYKSDDYINWTCGSQEFSFPIGELILSAEKTGFIKINCDFLIDPGHVNSIEVYAANDYCGDIIEELR